MMENTAFLLILNVFIQILATVDSYNFDQIMKIPLHLCSVVLYSHEYVEEEGEKYLEADKNLVEATLEKLVEIQVPLQLWVVRPSVALKRSAIYEGLRRNRKLTCITSLWFLKPRLSSAFKTQAVEPLPWVQYGYRIERTEYDYTILGFEDTQGYELRIDLTNPPAKISLPTAPLLPGNLILARMHSYTTDRGKAFYVESVGGLRYYCSSSRYFCVDWYNVLEAGVRIWETSTEFHKNLGKLSAYSSNGFYNFNKARIHVTATRGIVKPGYLDAIRDLGYRKSILPPSNKATKRRLYGTSRVESIYTAWYHVEILENIFNATMTFVSGDDRLSDNLNRWPGVVMETSRSQDTADTERALYYGFYGLNFYCVDSQHSRLQFHALFHPMDHGTWLALACAGGALALTFWRFTKSPVLNLIILFFGQGDGEEVKKFELLLILWSCLGLLLTAGYSSFIASMLIVPPGINYPKDYKEIYDEGYKIVRHASYKTTAWTMASLSNSHVWEDAKFKAKNAHLIRLDDDSVVNPDTRTSIPDYLVRHGKLCQNVQVEQPLEAFCLMISEAYEGSVCFTGKSPLFLGVLSLGFTVSSQEVLRRGVQGLYAMGTMDFFKNYEKLHASFEINRWFAEALVRVSPFYQAGYFFRITREYEPYLFTIRNAQGQMIFYFGLICAGMSLGGLILELVVGKWKIWYEATKARVEVKAMQLLKLSYVN